MKGPKIENIRDPKWIGKKICRPMAVIAIDGPYKLIHVGKAQTCLEDKVGGLCVASYNYDYWHEWIEVASYNPEEEKKPKFPFKVGDKIRNKEWRDVQCQYIELIDISESGFAFSTHPEPDHYFKWCSEAIRIDIQKDPSNWETYTPPKKKKTVALALVSFSGGCPILTHTTYPNCQEVKRRLGKNYEVIQFPAVTKNGTVLEFEVDDE